jgi:fructose-1,6-bisphosphatase
MRQINSEADYVVTFEPIDGGSIVDANYAVGSIFSIWATDNLKEVTGRDLIGAALSIYGSRTTILTFNAHNKHVEELTLLRLNNKYRWVVTNPKLEIQATCHNFSPEGVKACYDNPAYLKII